MTPARRVAVTVLIPQLARGGAELFAVELANRVDRSRFDVEVCVTRRTSLPDMKRSLEDTGLPVIDLDRTSFRDLRPWLRFTRRLRANPPDILHAHTFGSNVWASLIGRVARIPVIIATEHTWSYEGQPARVFLDRHIVARCTAFVAVSERDRERMIRVERVSPEVIRVIPTGYLGGAAVLPERPLRALLGVPDDALVVGTVAGLRPQKALHVLIRAFASARTHFPSAHLALVGDGVERPALESLITSLGLAGSVTLLGDRTDAVGLASQFDVFAMSSDYEGSPLALIEAMWWSRAVVATQVGGIPEMLADGEAGVLVPPGSPDELARALERLLGDARLRAELGARAAARAHDVYGFDRCVESWERLYSELYERRRSGRA